ncbi:Acetolactate synthase [Syntrophobacter sp. SbD1]|nr:Acetolactate synthase [Syntrophobacter sp. SbD1]
MKDFRNGDNAVKVGGKRSGAWLVRYALEQLPVSHTFGIPGVHNTEIYDELSKSATIHPVLVTHEVGAAFMADAISRCSAGEIGTLVIVPAAGLTHAMSGIGEAYLDGIPLLVISGGIRTDIDFGFKLHELDQHKILAGISKGSWLVKEHRDIVPAIFAAYHRAVSGMPGPVVVEIPANIQLFQGEVDALPVFRPHSPAMVEDETAFDQAVELLAEALKPGIFVGWGAVDVARETGRIAELLGAPVATTLQGMSAFPGNHPLHTGMGFSRAAVPAAENAFKECDCLLAVGARFGEIPTGSFGCTVPEDLIHVDVDPAAFNRNFPAKVMIAGDARIVVPRLLEKLAERRLQNDERRRLVVKQIVEDKNAYREEWYKHRNDRVNPAMFFDELRKQLADDAILVVDDGNHTFLAAELYEVRRERAFLSPTDFNCMGYCIPAAIGAKLVNPTRQVVGIVGDGAFMMTGLELLTAVTERAGIACFVFSDGELSQVAQGQEVTYNRKTCTLLGKLRLDGMALATGAGYVSIGGNSHIAGGIRAALAMADGGQPVIVDVNIDYSKRTRFTKGVVKTVLKRFPVSDRFRFIGRALVRKVTG